MGNNNTYEVSYNEFIKELENFKKVVDNKKSDGIDLTYAGNEVTDILTDNPIHIVNIAPKDAELLANVQSILPDLDERINELNDCCAPYDEVIEALQEFDELGRNDDSQNVTKDELSQAFDDISEVLNDNKYFIDNPLDEDAELIKEVKENTKVLEYMISLDVDYFILDSNFVDFAYEQALDLYGESTVSSWPMAYINWHQAANDLLTDYSAISFAGNTYYYR